MLPEPVLRWQQPVRGGDDGALYLWVREGRPVAAVTFFTYKLPSGVRWISHERHSFVTEPIQAAWRDRIVWKTSRAQGRPSRRVPDASRSGFGRAGPGPPEADASDRQGFAANTVDDKGLTWPLRLLGRPLYRFESENDGGIFAMVQGTDPEAFLLLRVHGEGSDALRRAPSTRFTDLEIHAGLNGREVLAGLHWRGFDEIYHRHRRDHQVERLSRGLPMKTAMMSILLFALLGPPPASQDDPLPAAGQSAKQQQWLANSSNRVEADGYTIYRDDCRAIALEARRSASFWPMSGRTRSATASRTGRCSSGRTAAWAEVIGTFFSFPPNGTRDLCHEFHSLSLSVLDVGRSPRANRWTPRPLQEFNRAESPIPSGRQPPQCPGQRLGEMRAPGPGDFSAETQDDKEQHWDLLAAWGSPSIDKESTDPRRPRTARTSPS